MKYKVLIIGLGQIGLTYDINSSSREVKTHTRAFLTNKSFEIVAGVDPSGEARSVFENCTGKKSFCSLEELDHCDRILDVIVVATPSNIRLKILKKLRQENYKSKMILLEKPIAMTVSEAIIVKRISLDVAKSLYINYIRRCDPVLKKLKEMICNDVYGIFLEASCWYYGGVFNIASHYIDLCQFLLGETLFLSFVSKKMVIDTDLVADFVLSTGAGQKIYFYSIEKKDIALEFSFEKANVEILNNGNVVKVRNVSGQQVLSQTMLYEYQRNVVKEIELKFLMGTKVSLDSGEEVAKLCEQIRFFKL